MRMSILVEKLWIENKEFVTSEELKEYCKSMKMDYILVIRYLVSRKPYLVRIFRGIFYVKSLEEFKLGKSKYNHLELVAKGLELKGVKNWYFGLHTALKLNNMTHEHFTVDEVISDSLFRAKPINIAGHKFRFVKLSPSLLNFGIKREGLLRYSDPEKTILDFIYLSRQEGVPNDRILVNMSSWAEGLMKERISQHAKKYPKTVIVTVRQAIK
ncbi:MAG: type IV toxin-antitoxin system AbiEi family antitoxin domain-containing protein [Nitrososphaera sp.]